MICAQFDTAGALIASPIQPADLATCTAVLITGSELSAVTGISIPSPTDFAAAWALGFSLVVSSYILGWAPGVLLRFFRS